MNDNRAPCFVPVLALSYLASAILGFNVDTDTPLVFKGPTNSYFGYSVAILENVQGTWLLAGAPRANDSSLPSVHEPGAVFQCNWQYRSSCQPVFIDDIGNDKQTFSKWKDVSVHHIKNNQWLGASIDVNVNGDSHVMICAPRWINHKFNVQGLKLMNGLCYESNRELRFNDSSAWPALEYWKKQLHAAGYFSYGMGSLGTAAHYSQDGSFRVLGAPGLNDWAGGYAFIDGNHTSKPHVLEVPVETDKDSYFGMSVTTARLSSEGIFTIIGGPRAGGNGKIYAYNSNFQLVLVKEGSQLGSSFGSSVCAVDLNGDGLDDLAVGAPLYTDQLDEGRVYIYINREFFNLELVSPLLKGSNSPSARFGTAIANLGDLNLDSYADIAVGAPYEEESGVVYIYNGAKSGLHMEPSQRIVGKDLNQDLKAFGWSFSRPWDVDGNHYGDFAVGAFQSNRVVLLRTRSVLDLNANLELSPALIDLSGSPSCLFRGQPRQCFEATVCLQYTGKNLPPSSDVNITLRLDTLERHRGERSRLFAQGQGYTEIETISEIVALRLDRIMCGKKYTIFVRESRDIITPLQLELEFDIATNSIGIASMCTICPIRNKYNPTIVHKKAHFALDCGADHNCQPDFTIGMTPVFNNGGQSFMIDDSPSFDMEISLTNSGETSYLTTVNVEYPSFIYFLVAEVVEGSTYVSCIPVPDDANTTTVSIDCDIMTPIRTGDKVGLNFRFSAHGISYNVHQFDMRAKVRSVKKDSNSGSGEITITETIPVKMQTQIKLSGVSIPGQLSLPRKLASADEWISVSHLFIVRNLGPSPMPHGQLLLYVPATEWVMLTNVQVETKAATDISSHVPVECSMSSDVTGIQPNVSRDHSTDAKLSADTLMSYVTCDTVPCSTVTCYIGLMHKYETVYINTSLSLRRDVLQALKVDNQLGLVSSGKLQEPDNISYNSLTTSSNVTATTYVIFKTLPRQAVTWWILIISIFSGLLLFYIVAVIMWKCGFFRRKQREELQLLIKLSETEREGLTSDSVSTGSSDVMMLPPGHSMVSTNNNHHDHREDGLFYYPELEVDHSPFEQHFDRQNYFQNQSLNRRDVNHRPPNLQNFHTLQHVHSNNHHHHHHRSRIPHRSIDRHWNGGVCHNGHRKSNPRDITGDGNAEQNIWVAPPAAPPPPPAFNNDMYLEPLESRA